MANEKILCIEDEPEIIDLMRLILETYGYRTVSARGGEQGLAKMRSERPDLVLLDIMMPDMDGRDLYHRMRQDPELSQIPVIVVSAKTEPIDQAVWMAVGQVDDYVTKPFNPDDLLASVERVLARRSAL